MHTNFSRLPFTDQSFAPGASGDEVYAVQNYLSHYGYLQTALGTIHDGEFDPVTEQAVRLYQNYFGLPVSGMLDTPTLCEMAKPRCGCRDIPLMSGAFSTISRWDKLDLTYKFASFSQKLSNEIVERDVAAAFKLWSDECALRFMCTPEADNVDIVIEFAAGEHGDADPFDGPSGVLAHAFFPPPNGGTFAGDAHFDEDENWTSSLTQTSGFDFLTVAAHEFGHSIGLGHSRDRAALMFPSYSGAHRFLAQDDIAGCQSLYGAALMG